MQDSKMVLERARFSVAWAKLGARHDLVFDLLVARYGEAHRAYHNAEHLLECLAWLDQARDHAQRPDELEVALMFHDVVYDPAATDNERASAELCVQSATEAGVSSEAIERIAELIRATATHDSTSHDGALLNDIDLAILGAGRGRFERFERAVRSEYAAFDDERYRCGRAQVLERFRARAFIYQTEFFRGRLEAPARQNIERALAHLHNASGER